MDLNAGLWRLKYKKKNIMHCSNKVIWHRKNDRKKYINRGDEPYTTWKKAIHFLYQRSNFSSLIIQMIEFSFPNRNNQFFLIIFQTNKRSVIVLLNYTLCPSLSLKRSWKQEWFFSPCQQKVSATSSLQLVSVKRQTQQVLNFASSSWRLKPPS